MKKHWSVDEEKFKKENPEKYRLWRLVFLINDGGLEKDERLNKKEIIKAWPKIKDEIDPYYKRLIEFLLWGKLYSLPANLSFFGNYPKMKS